MDQIPSLLSINESLPLSCAVAPLAKNLKELFRIELSFDLTKMMENEPPRGGKNQP